MRKKPSKSNRIFNLNVNFNVDFGSCIIMIPIIIYTYISLF